MTKKENGSSNLLVLSPKFDKIVIKLVCEDCILRYAKENKLTHINNDKYFRKGLNDYLRGFYKTYSDIAIVKALTNLTSYKFLSKLERGKYLVNGYLINTKKYSEVKKQTDTV